MNRSGSTRLAAGYTRGEVVWLLSLTREQAIDLDAHGPDSCANLTDDDIDVSVSAEDDPVMVIARWWDVQRAKGEVVHEKEGLAILQLRAGGFSEREIARLAARDRMAVQRRWHATVDEILARLGGEYQKPMAMSRISLCLSCGENPRARLAAVRRRVKGGWRIVEEERQASVCTSCLTPALAPRALHPKVEDDRAAA